MTTKSKESSGYKFGTFGGVFTPSILTIFGLIMFMRTNYVVGVAGVLGALAILLVAESITIASGLSISAISTNTPVKGGGAYFLISRSLGPGFGSSIGVTLFIAQALSVPFYILGFSEALTKNFPAIEPYYLWLVLGTGLIILIMAWVGASWVIKCQYFILAILVLSIITFLGGALDSFSLKTLEANMAVSDGANLSMLFAIFFPAVTGIMAGVNMSGDLKSPEKSLPRGTMLAIFCGLIVYAIQMVICGGAFDRETLITQPYQILVKTALFGAGFMVLAGVASATLSSALGSCMGAPRVLQALAKDKIIRVLNPFRKGSGPNNEPKSALLPTAIIGIIVLVWGGMSGISKDGEGGALNAVAIIVTMFFLYTYGMVNLAAFVESYGANPSFRPRFKFFHWSTALFGAIACIGVSFMIHALGSAIALAFITAIFFMARRRDMKRTFGDARRGFTYSRIRNNLLALAEMPPDPKNWRPTITVLSGNPNTRGMLVDFATRFECNRGITSLAEIVVGSRDDMVRLRRETMQKLKAFISEGELEIFPEAVVCEDFDRGLHTFLQAHSIGPIKPNIMMLGFPADAKRIEPFTEHIRTIARIGMSSLTVVNPLNQPCPKNITGRIDIWWRGQRNGSLMLILGYLMILNQTLNRVSLRVVRLASSETERGRDKAELDALIEAARIEATSKVIVSDNDFRQVFRNESSDALTILMGASFPKTGIENSVFNSIHTLAEGMPPIIMVASNGEADLSA
jgi:solute carrier family 12 (sodium/potassium/chloride transporter), member 2